MPEAKDRSTGEGPTALAGDDLIVKADPDKLFFINMLVKDIELVPAVLDLVDNSVDSARSLALADAARTKALAEVARDGQDLAPEPLAGAEDEQPKEDLPEDAFQGLHVSVVANGDSFSVTDNCAGISVETARNYAFRFGRPKAFKGVPGSVGEFGVGMKRALFKLGIGFRVTSRTDSSEFELDVVVGDWASEPGTDWTFEMGHATEGLEPDANARGTVVAVSPLHSSVSQDLDDPIVLGQLREQMRIRHQGALARGLSLSLNGEALSGLLPSLLSGPMFQPANRALVVSEPEGDVFVRIVAGVVASDRKNVDEGQAEEFRSSGEAGWWVFCNERLLLAADRSAETGWGNPAALYHPQYRTFRGYVYLQAINPALLPWNTTKTDVDQDSPVWRRVQSEMKRTLVDVQAVINKVKRERASIDDDYEDVESPPTPVVDALEAAVLTPLRALPPSEGPRVPPPTPAPRRPPPARSSWQKVQFNVEKTRFEKAADVLDARNTAEVGRGAFDYFYRREVEDQ